MLPFAFDEGNPMPTALDEAGIEGVVDEGGRLYGQWLRGDERERARTQEASNE